jgi:hypothetical protein
MHPHLSHILAEARSAELARDAQRPDRAGAPLERVRARPVRRRMRAFVISHVWPRAVTREVVTDPCDP